MFMNQIFFLNMESVMAGRSEPVPQMDMPIRLLKGTKSKEVIEYLFEHGETKSSDIVVALDLKNTPQCYIQPHIKTGRVLIRRPNPNEVFYRMNEKLTKSDFGL